ncbi:uncharacterized protein LOC119315969 [Triticum dicoccoides]|uniref:uncharacterized protein LOC119315969 n=1 Tax=Triticum dicoccoides TaxID=85692 RepID=UPI001890C417|nr:uncharacterized protein LOC119315969 [Triticum dicoccoides]
MGSPMNDVNPFSSTNLGAGMPSSDLQDQGASRRDEVECATSANSEQKGVELMKKRKHSQVALALEDYIDFRKKQDAKLDEELKESKNPHPDGHSVAPVSTLQMNRMRMRSTLKYMQFFLSAPSFSMTSLFFPEKAKALWLFKCPMNREIFINTKNPRIRLFWLKEEIAAIERS